MPKNIDLSQSVTFKTVWRLLTPKNTKVPKPRWVIIVGVT